MLKINNKNTSMSIQTWIGDETNKTKINKTITTNLHDTSEPTFIKSTDQQIPTRHEGGRNQTRHPQATSTRSIPNID